MIVYFNNRKLNLNDKCHVFYTNGTYKTYSSHHKVKSKNKSILCINEGKPIDNLEENRYAWIDKDCIYIRSDISPRDITDREIDDGKMMCWINPMKMINDMRNGGDFHVLSMVNSSGSKYSTLVNYCSHGSVPPHPDEFGMYIFVGCGVVDVDVTVNIKFGDKYELSKIRETIGKSKFKNTNKYLPYRDK